MGIEASFANNGEEAVNLIKANQYDLIFMDINMPVLGGLEATTKIRTYEQELNLKEIPIIALTANVMQSDVSNYLNHKMNGHIAKPYNIKEIEKVLLEFIDK
jgi:CheY-like chemotaxis protein